MVIDFEKLRRYADDFRASYAEASPYPHAVIDDFLPAESAEQLWADFEAASDPADPAGGWKHYTHFNERKFALTDLERMPRHTQQVMSALQSQAALDFVGALSGTDSLLADPDLEGAGMHVVRRGGFLNLHTDFLTHTKKPTWARRINLLLYLNKDWDEAWNGNLELWQPDMSACSQSIAPAFNRCVIFSTIENSFHGHPHKLSCPESRERRCLLLYYYTNEGRELDFSSTDYRAMPGTSVWKRLLIAADRAALRGYTFIKKRSKLTDDWVSRILRRF